MNGQVTVEGLTYYPVKGGAGIAVPETRITAHGLPGDRAWVITDGSGRLRWQGGDPRLALLVPEPDPDGGTGLTLRAPDAPELRVEHVEEAAGAAGPAGPGATGGVGRPVELPGQTYGGLDAGEEAAAWVTKVLGAPSRLVRVRAADAGSGTDDGSGSGTGTGAGPVARVANHSRVHVVSRASLALLNTRLAEQGLPALPMNRFRPNVVIDGWDAPHTEDESPVLELGRARLVFTERTVRCAITMVDQERGVRSGPEPLRTLARYRRAAEGIVFGAYFDVRREGRVAVGDRVERPAP
ncbi:MOSC domain-containing protein [Streptomyces sp. NPDC058417]|uniref:MOSC domain-containing protein n=1 Tax=unclassified Streptomyces TaxID=2593676 RepID=UPI003665AE50